MKFNKKLKKGFTLIELVVVIAVIAILSTIAVISFMSVTNKAKESNDHMIIDQINLALRGDAIFNKKTTVHKLVENLVEEEGFDVRNLKAEVKDAKFVYSYEKHMFGYLKNNKVTYPKDLAGTPISNDLWLILDLKGDSSKNVDLTTGDYKEFSCYVRSINNVETIKTKEGLDVGKTFGIKQINYVNSEAQSVIIRTNSAKTSLSVNAPNDTISHYDAMGGLEIIAVAKASYHEHGSVAFAEISTGRIVLENNSDIDHIHINKKESEEAFDEVIIQDNGAVELPEKITRDQVDVASATPVVTVEQNGTSETVYVYPYTDTADVATGTTEKTGVQNPTIGTPLGYLVLDNGADAGEKAMSNNDKTEAKQEVINQAIAVEEREEAAEHGYCIHEYELSRVITEPTCLLNGEAEEICKLCGDIRYVSIEKLNHSDLIGTFCNICKHPIAFIEENIDDFTLNDEFNRKVQVAPYVDPENPSSVLSPEYPAYLTLDIAYSFKAFEDLENRTLDVTKSYNLDMELEKFVEVNPGDGDFSAKDIYDFFGRWMCDYYVSFDKDVMPFTCGLGGHYDSYAEEAIGFLVPPLYGFNNPIPGGVDIPLLKTMLGDDYFNYDLICTMVTDFRCGFFNLDDANTGKKFTVKLRMINPHTHPLDELFANYIDVAVTEYMIEEPSEENLAIAAEYLENHPEMVAILYPELAEQND